MAKDLTPIELAAALQSMGLTIPEDLAAKVENSVSDRAEEYLSERLVSESGSKENVEESAEWRESIFTLAESFAESFTGQEKNVGQGRVFERFVEIETPAGKFALRLREPREKK